MRRSNSTLTVVETVEKTGKKNQQHQQHIIGIINSLIGVIEKAEQDIMSIESQNGRQIHERIEKLHSSISELKPLSGLSKVHPEMYKRLSKLGKELDTLIEQKVPIRLQDYLNCSMDQNLLMLAIHEYFMKEGNTDAAKLTGIAHPYSDIYDRGLKLRDMILDGEYEEAISWAEAEQLYENNNHDIEFQLRKRLFLKLVEKGQINEAISYCKSHMSKFISTKIEQIQQIMGYLLFFNTGTELNRNYQQLKQLNQNKMAIAKQFLMLFYDHYGINNLNSLDICLRAGLKAQDIFRTFMPKEQPTGRKDQLQFTYENPDYQYHSLFVCPVTKEVSDPSDKPIVLRCGHVLSEHSFNRIVDNRTKMKFRCPVCQAQQRLSDVVQMHF